MKTLKFLIIALGLFAFVACQKETKETRVIEKEVPAETEAKDDDGTKVKLNVDEDKKSLDVKSEDVEVSVGDEDDGGGN